MAPLLAAHDCGRIMGRLGRRTHDRVPPEIARVRRTEERYSVELRKIARHVGQMIRGFAPDGVIDLAQFPDLQAALDAYANAVTPWAKATAARMIEEISITQEAAWRSQAQAMSLALRQELARAPTGEMMRLRIAEQVADIKSIPTDAAQRLYELTIKGMSTATRADSYVAEIMRSGEVAQSRAIMLARTAVSTTASTLTQARAEWVGSEGYHWKTVRDASVRPSHKKMEGRFVLWSQPPTLDGYTAHAGCFANCRCSPSPVFSDF